MLRFSRENKKQIKIILDGIFKIYLKIFLNRFKPKKYQAYQKYVVISAVYNVEKYLKDYFNSIIHQRLDFKNNILLILVDDGSTDKSATIIKAYQKKYPKNIIYLYKENGGQASARNLGLKYLEQNLKESFKFLSKSNNKNLDSIDSSKLNTTSLNSLNSTLPFIPTWVSFTDPDDFLDRDCFYKVDKFLNKNKNENLVMIGLNNQLYFENTKSIKDHPLHHYKFQEKENKVFVEELTFEIHTATRICFKREKIIGRNNIYFNEYMGHSEDLNFTLEVCTSCAPYDIFAFLNDAKYYIRKRSDNSSTMNNFLKDKRTFINTPRALLARIKQDNSFYAQSCIFSSLLNTINQLIGKKQIFILNQKEQNEFLTLLDEIFSYINTEIILDFRGFGNDMFKKIGILHCFKNEKIPIKNITYINNSDPYKQMILLSYFTDDAHSCESIRINGKEIFADYEKIVRHCFLDRAFCYEKRLWVHIPLSQKRSVLEVFIDSNKAYIEIFGKKDITIKEVKEKFINQQKEELWLFIDRDIEADDNAERLYRYVQQNYPQQRIVFALDKNCPDWQRLSQQGFNLVHVYSKEFFSLAKAARNFITSHTPIGFRVILERGQRFICLGHGLDGVEESRFLFKRLNSIYSKISEY